LAAKGKDTPPAFSTGGRAKPPKIIETPAATDYHIEKSDRFVVSSAPKFTFGVKKYSGVSDYETPGTLGILNTLTLNILTLSCIT
jgi:hypothetical protein